MMQSVCIDDFDILEAVECVAIRLVIFVSQGPMPGETVERPTPHLGISQKCDARLHTYSYILMIIGRLLAHFGGSH